MNFSDEFPTDSSQKSDIAPSADFIRVLRGALNHLYNPDTLRQSHLAVVFGIDHRFNTPAALQAILMKAIDALKPRLDAPNRTHAQQVYDLLLYRYVQRVNQDEVARQLGISVRHLQRQQNLAVYELACKLWETYHLDDPKAPAADARPATDAAAAVHRVEGDAKFSQELDWLKNSALQVQTDLALAIPEALELIQPLLAQTRSHIHVPEKIAGLLVVHWVAFQQVLLSLLSFSVRMCGENGVQLALIPHPGQQEIRITGSRSAQNAPDKAEEHEFLETLSKLVTLSQGSFSVQPPGPVFQVTVRFGAIEPVGVLVVDDNPDMITMMQRFTAKTPYRIHGVSDPQLAIEQALKLRPVVIVLDIMMPQVDGLQILSRFKHHPELGHIPVMICSVLPQKDLASSLGAYRFIAKPIQRDTFIAALDAAHQQAMRMNGDGAVTHPGAPL